MSTGRCQCRVLEWNMSTTAAWQGSAAELLAELAPLETRLHSTWAEMLSVMRSARTDHSGGCVVVSDYHNQARRSALDAWEPSLDTYLELVSEGLSRGALIGALLVVHGGRRDGSTRVVADLDHRPTGSTEIARSSRSQASDRAVVIDAHLAPTGAYGTSAVVAGGRSLDSAGRSGRGNCGCLSGGCFSGGRDHRWRKGN